MRMTTLCYIEQDGKYLMLHRTKKKKDINKDKWIGVGGHAEEGEGPEGFQGHALSISDVVEFADGEVSRFFYVEPSGYEEIRF